MPTKHNRQFGLWDSPITPASLATDLRLEDVGWDTDGQSLVWLEGRSDCGVLVAQSFEGDASRDLTDEHDVRAEVGYGGGDFTLHGGCVYFVERGTGRLYRQPLAGGEANAITPAFGKIASPAVSPDGRFVVYVHSDDEENDRLGVVDSEGKLWPQILASGHDFYMQPRVSPDGSRVCWIAWDHPNMPWDGTNLFLAPIEACDPLPRLGEPQAIAGGDEVAVFQPEFTPDGKCLLYVSDESGWGRITALELKSGERRTLTPEGAEHGLPPWQQGVRTYAVTADGRHIIAVRNEHGFDRLYRIALGSGEIQSLDALAEYSTIARITAARDGERIAFIGSGPTQPPRVVVHDLQSGQTRVIARASGENVSSAALANCRAISWQTAGGDEAHGLFYEPASEKFTSSGKPPLLVLVHGGPTSQAKAAWNPQAQFFATRGYAVLLVNYRGSTGYGRAYMLRLRGNWGICDVEDSISGAGHLADEGLIDPDTTAIMGGSAGGFTVLETMSKHPEAFNVGVSLYGVADQFHLAAETHKFESRYSDTLLGPLPEAAEVYRQRSPIHFADSIRRPIALFQGEIDQVVPRAQSDVIAEALKKSGVAHVYHVYEGEGHGWRKRETIEHYYRAVDAFLREHLIYA